MLDWHYIHNRNTTEPALNLALEEYVLRRFDPEHDYLIVCQNGPSVIVGRNQNVFEEVNIAYVHDEGIPVYRRLSGGGTVYHGPGNLSFSFITRYEPSRLNNYRFFNAPVVRVLKSLGVPAYMNDRNDILAEGKKISGSAQFSSRGRMFSHGTLLFNARLDELENALKVPQNGEIQSRSQKSVRSRVANISGFLSRQMDIRSFHDYLVKELIDQSTQTGKPLNGPESATGNNPSDSAGSRSIHLTDEQWQEVLDIRDQRYRTWQWNIGRSPAFQIARKRVIRGEEVSLEMSVAKGYIENLSIRTGTIRSGTTLQNEAALLAATLGTTLQNEAALLAVALTGTRYDYADLKSRLTGMADEKKLQAASPQEYMSLLLGTN